MSIKSCKHTQNSRYKCVPILKGLKLPTDSALTT
ncbi:hypothetical protein E2C01_012185 [Portunus trituberculatus]|uniref:Uncharacterized protein n=1 Tax=Portunus trituberculatus TaxID=210409 RepID=A0A5B7DDC2_PORTR|nr:hypothetical protein [Portunus trituberculatus]